MRRVKIIAMPALGLIMALTIASTGISRDGHDFPEDVSAVLEKSCMGCHSTDSKAKDAHEALDLKKWEDLSKTKKISALNDIAEVVEEDAMPPERFLKKYPDNALTDKEKKLLIKWSKAEQDKLMGK